MMRSWTLLAHLLPRRDTLDDDPVARRAASFPPGWLRSAWLVSGLPAIVSLWGLFQVVAILAGPPGLATISLTSVLCCLFPLFVLSPSLVLWVLPLSLALAPSVVRERERRTWDTLRATPLSLESILLSKAAGILSWLRGPLRNGQAVIVLAAISTGLILLIRLREGVGTIQDGLPPLGLGVVALWVVALLGAALFMADRAPQYGLMAVAALAVSVVAASERSAPVSAAVAVFGVWLVDIVGVAALLGALLLGAALFVADRAQQFVLMAVTALAVSATVRSERAALASAAAAVFGVWLADIVIAVMVMALVPSEMLRYLGIRTLTVVALGPVGAYVFDLPPTALPVMIPVTLLGREIVIRAAWRWTCAAAS